MARIPSATWSSEVLRLKAEVLARGLESDPRVADLAPVIRGVADRLTAAAEKAHTTRMEERACHAKLALCEEAVLHAVRVGEAALRAAIGADRNHEAYRKAFPKGLMGATSGRRDAWMRRAAIAGEALAGMPGLEAPGKAVTDAVAAAETARSAWTAAARAALVATQDKDAAKEALVEEFRVQRAVVKGRLRTQAAVDALFPNLSPTAPAAQANGKGGNGTGDGGADAGIAVADPPQPGAGAG